MKVVLIYRHKRAGAYSLEELFHTIAVELHKHIDVIEYEVGTRWNLLNDIVRLRRINADIYHITGDITYLTLFLPSRRTVLTIPDIGHYLFGLQGIKRIIYKWLWLLMPIYVARSVTVISRETQDNIVNHLGVSRNKVEILECCYSSIFQQDIRPFNSVCPNVLHIGTNVNKNVPRLIEALQGVKCRLILIGQLNSDLKDLLIRYKTDYLNLSNLSHEEIAQQYAQCDIVSFVSLGEGFGVPIIEAQATGRPLITSNISPMREVAGDGACLVDPLDVMQIRNGVAKIISDAAYREVLIAKGLQNVERYSPATISNHYLKLYKNGLLTEKQ